MKIEFVQSIDHVESILVEGSPTFKTILEDWSRELKS